MSPAKRYIVAPQGGGPPLLITTNSPLVSGEVGLAYSQTLQGSGGAPPYFWSLISGFFPTGLGLSVGGVVSGTPSATGSSTVTLQIMDSRGTRSPTKSFGITVVAAVTITTGATLPTATQGVPYTQTLAATGGVTPYTWSLLSQTGSNTWSVSPSGNVTGTPSVSETDTLDIQVIDALGGISTRVFSLTVQNSLYITTTSPLSGATQGSAYSFTMAAAGGTSPYTWSLTSQTGSNSWSLSSAGVVTGTPANVETDSLVIKVADSASATFSGTFTITTSAVPTSIYAGFNVSVLQVSPTEQPFLNIAKISSSNNTNFTGWAGSGGTTAQQINAVVDSNGYMTSLPGGNLVTQYMNAGMNNQDPLGANGSGIGNGLPPGASVLYPSGSYTLQFQGACTLVFLFSGDVVSGSLATTSTNVAVSGLTINSTMTSAQTGIVTFNVTPSTSGVLMNITALPSNTNYFRNHSIVRTSQVSAYNSGTLIDPNWVAMITNNGAGGVKRIRYMNALQMVNSTATGTPGQLYQFTVPALTPASSLTQTMTAAWAGASGTYNCVLGSGNSPYDTAQNNTVTMVNGSTTAVFGSAFTQNVTAAGTNLWVHAFSGWATRNQPGFAFWLAANGNGTPPMLPYETCIAMSNATNTDCWLNIPLWANSFTGQQAFWTSLANLVKSNLNSGLKCYIELGNEVFIETDEPYANMLAKTQLGTADFVSWMGLQLALISQAFSAVFGSSFASTIMIGPMTECNNGNGLSFLEAMMNGPSIGGGTYPNSFLSAAPYTYFTHWGCAPYWGSPSSADYVTMMGTANPLNDFFNCMYGNVGTAGNGSITYSSVNASGFIGGVVNSFASLIAGIAGQPWVSYPRHLYESGPSFACSSSSFSNTPGSYTGPYGGGTYTTVRSACQALIGNAMRDPRMGYGLYDPTHQLSSNPGFLPAIVSAGATSMNYFDNCQFMSQFGSWGALENVMQLPSSGGTGTAASFPKYAAIMNWITGSGATFNFYISPTGSDSNAGSLASPWSITAINTHQSTYAGQRLGIMPGRYDVSTLMQAATYQGAVLQIQGGPNSSTKTYIGTCNSSGQYQAGTATITAYGSVGAYGGGNTTHTPYVIGQTVASVATGTGPQPTNIGNWTLDGLIITGFNAWAIALSGGEDTLPSQVVNATIQNCTLANSANNVSGTHPGAIMCYAYQNCLITNCMFSNNICTSGEDATHAGSAVTAWGFGGGTSGLVIDHCTILETQGIVIGEDNGTCQNSTIQYCYADFTPTTDVTNVDFLSSGTNTTTTATPGNSIHHNIIVAGTPRDSIGYSSEQGAAPEAFYNNTWIRNASGLLGYRYVEASGKSALVTAYNNLMYDNGNSGAGAYGYMAGNVDVFALCDYNIYGTLMSGTQFSTYASGSAGGATGQTFANWKTAIGAKDAHSSQSGTNPFTNAGTYALQYTVASGSPAYQTGKVGGLSSGATCNVGAWDGTVTQIGSTLPVPGTTP